MTKSSRKKWQQFYKLEKKAGAESFFENIPANPETEEPSSWKVYITDANNGEIIHEIECMTFTDAKKGTRGLLKSIIDRKELEK